MKNKKFIAAISAFGAIALGIGASAIAFANHPSYVYAEDVTEIGDLATFKKVFDGSANYYNKSVKLTADIDYGGGAAIGLRMAGSFSGTFDGNGHVISNINLSQAFFNLVSGTVKNLTLDCTSTGSGFGGLAYAIETVGKVSNVTVNATLGAAVNNWGPIAFWSKGAIEDCKTRITIPSDYSAANTLFHVARADSGSVFTNDIYKVTGSGSFLADPVGVSEMVAVSAATVADISLSATTTATAVATLTGNDYDHIKWVIADTSIATVTSDKTTTNKVTINGLVAGNTTITATVYGDSSEQNVLAGPITANIAVTSTSPVSAVALDKATDIIYAGKTDTLTATLTGTEYSTITWASDAESIATVSGSGVSATITGIAAGSANITVSVVSTSGTYTATCALTVNPKVTVNVVLLESKNTAGKTAYWDQAYVHAYGEFDIGADEPMTKVQSNGHDLVLRFANPTNKNVVDEYKAWSYDIDITGKTMAWTNAWVQFGQKAGEYWGSGFQITSAIGKTAILGYMGSVAPADSGYAPADVKTAANYAANNVYGSSWRDNSSSICYLLDGAHNDTLNTLLTSYDSLADSVKPIANVINDTTSAYTATYGETIAMLKARSTYSDGVYVAKIYDGGTTLLTSDDKSGKSWIAVATGLGVIALAAASAYLLKKKTQC